MKSLRDVVLFAHENKQFVFQLGAHLGFAVLLLVGGLGVQLYTTSSTEQAVASAVSAVTPALPRPLVAQLNLNQPANLTPQQWEEVGVVLRSLPDALDNMNCLRNCAQQRQQAMTFLGNVVFARFNELPQSAKNDWQALANIKLDDSAGMLFYMNPRASDTQQLYISKTLSVQEDQNVIQAREGYHEVRKRLLESIAIVDRLVPVFVSMGLGDQDQSTSDSLRILKYSFEEYCKTYSQSSYKYGIKSYHPEELPPLNLTSDQVVKQLSQPPLSIGNTSNERAGNPNSPAQPGRAQPTVFGPPGNN
jgi:hypothetical protein